MRPKPLIARLARRPVFVSLFLLLIAAPGLATLLLPAPNGAAENRRLAPPPVLRWSQSALLALPAATDRWIDDHFGFRDALVRVNNFVLWHGFGEPNNPRLLAGRHGRLFLGAHDGEAYDTLISGVCSAGARMHAADDAASAIRSVLDELHASGLDATLLIVPTAARLYPEDLPPRLAPLCRDVNFPTDRLASLLRDRDVVYPIDTMLALKRRGIAPIPPYHFHWAGEAPLRIAELVAETGWGLTRVAPLPLRWIGRSSDIGSLNPGMALSDRIHEPQVRAIGMTDCVSVACAAQADLPSGPAQALEHYARPGPGPEMLIVADSFGDEIARDFTEQFSQVWHLHTNISDRLDDADRRLLARWMVYRFRGRHVLLVYHDMAAMAGLTSVARLLDATR